MSSSYFSFSSMAFMLVIALATLFVLPTISTSGHTFITKTGFKVSLRHVDSGKNFTKSELLQRAMKRGKERMKRIYTMTLAASDPSIEAPVHAGRGEFLMNLAIGTPAVHYSAVLDTGSDLIWTQCKPCRHCFKQKTTLFDPRKSSSYTKLQCSSDLCQALPRASCTSSNCEYTYMYGDYSLTQGVMATETFIFNKVSVPRLGFGCGHQNSGFDEGAGLVGMGRGPLSLVSQLDEPKFSYCLTSTDSTKASTLLVGSRATANTTLRFESVKTTPLVKSQTTPTFYYLSLEGITVGNTRLPIENSTFTLQKDGTGGMIIDSGTTLTYLEGSAFELLTEEFRNQINLRVADPGDTGLELCFDAPASRNVRVPRLIFHFEGADLQLRSKNYMIRSNGILCLAMGSSSGMSIFGNYQQQDTLVFHDLVKGTISFVHTNCDKL